MSTRQEWEIGPKVIDHTELIVPSHLYRESLESLRDQFAMAALTGIINSYVSGMVLSRESEELASSAEISRQSYQLADAMLEARKQGAGK